MNFQSSIAPAGSGFRIAARPALWQSSQRTGICPLPACANSGQYAATGASRSSAPFSASRLAQIAVMPLVVEYTFTIVSRFHGWVRAPSRCPPQRSTTSSPSTVTATAAPTSPLSKFAAKASRTRSNRFAHSPETAAMPTSCPLSRRVAGGILHARAAAPARHLQPRPDPPGRGTPGARFPGGHRPCYEGGVSRRMVETIESPEFLEEVVPVKPGGTLFVRSARGTVDVRVHDLDEVRVEAEARGRHPERVIFTLECADDDVRFEVHVEGWLTGLFGGIDVRTRIWVPQQYSLVLRNSGGDARVDGITGNVDLETSGGDVTLSRITGRLGLHTSGGKLELEHLDGCVRARSSGGDAVLRDVFGDVDVRTSGGNLTIDGVDGASTRGSPAATPPSCSSAIPRARSAAPAATSTCGSTKTRTSTSTPRRTAASLKVDVELDRKWQHDKLRVHGRRGQRGSRLKIRSNGGGIRVGLI